ncbi:VWA domain-containing protein [archaeon]|nr:MAG: VWA domain-containing protein [archaeon]
MLARPCTRCSSSPTCPLRSRLRMQQRYATFSPLRKALLARARSVTHTRARVHVCVYAMQSRVGLVRFGSSASLSIRMGSSASNAAFRTSVLGLGYGGGYTNTWSAIDTARGEFIARGNPASAAVPKVMFVVTDGQSQIPGCVYPCSTERTRTAADAARAAGITVAILTVGPASNFNDGVRCFPSP